MASVERRAKQVATNNAYYINLADIRTSILYNQGTDEAPLLSTTALLNNWSTAAVSSQTSVAGAAILRDMGKNLVSSGRVFRKIQLVGQSASGGSLSTGGVLGGAGSTAPDFLTGYIELPGLQGSASGGVPAKVARLG